MSKGLGVVLTCGGGVGSPPAAVVEVFHVAVAFVGLAVHHRLIVVAADVAGSDACEKLCIDRPIDDGELLRPIENGPSEAFWDPHGDAVRVKGWLVLETENLEPVVVYVASLLAPDFTYEGHDTDGVAFSHAADNAEQNLLALVEVDQVVGEE